MTRADAETGSAAIGAAFRGHGRKAALMPYMMGGFPEPGLTAAIAQAYVDGGADLIEYGLPFSDPLADGPVIHDAAIRALAAGAVTDDLLTTIAPVATQVPVLAMTYYNLIEVRGVERFLDHVAQVGICGVIVPDLPFDEAGQMLAACDARGLALVPLVAPNTTDERLELLAQRARGFVYAVSYTGTTGGGLAPDEVLAELVTRIRAHTDLPVAVGFGIATPDDAARVAAVADGAIVGTRMVREAGERFAAGDDPAAAVGRLVADFAAAL